MVMLLILALSLPLLVLLVASAPSHLQSPIRFQTHQSFETFFCNFTVLHSQQWVGSTANSFFELTCLFDIQVYKEMMMSMKRRWNLFIDKINDKLSKNGEWNANAAALIRKCDTWEKRAPYIEPANVWLRHYHASRVRKRPSQTIRYVSYLLKDDGILSMQMVSVSPLSWIVADLLHNISMATIQLAKATPTFATSSWTRHGLTWSIILTWGSIIPLHEGVR